MPQLVGDVVTEGDLRPGVVAHGYKTRTTLVGKGRNQQRITKPHPACRAEDEASPATTYAFSVGWALKAGAVLCGTCFPGQA